MVRALNLGSCCCSNRQRDKYEIYVRLRGRETIGRSVQGGGDGAWEDDGWADEAGQKQNTAQQTTRETAKRKQQYKKK